MNVGHAQGRWKVASLGSWARAGERTMLSESNVRYAAPEILHAELQGVRRASLSHKYHNSSNIGNAGARCSPFADSVRLTRPEALENCYKF